LAIQIVSKGLVRVRGRQHGLRRPYQGDLPVGPRPAAADRGARHHAFEDVAREPAARLGYRRGELALGEAPERHLEVAQGAGHHDLRCRV
jgi:hypothetical protein